MSVVNFEERETSQGRRIGVARLNAPRTLNSLTLEMIELLLPLLPHGAPPPATPGAEAAPSHSSASASQALSTGFQPPAASRGRCGCPSSSVPSR